MYSGLHTTAMSNTQEWAWLPCVLDCELYAGRSEDEVADCNNDRHNQVHAGKRVEDEVIPVKQQTVTLDMIANTVIGSKQTDQSMLYSG